MEDLEKTSRSRFLLYRISLLGRYHVVAEGDNGFLSVVFMNSHYLTIQPMAITFAGYKIERKSENLSKSSIIIRILYIRPYIHLRRLCEGPATSSGACVINCIYRG